RRLSDPHSRCCQEGKQHPITLGCRFDDLPQLLLREVALPGSSGSALIEFPRDPDLPSQHELDDAYDLQDGLAAQTLRLDQRAARQTPFKRRTLEIRHELLNDRFRYRFHCQRSKPRQDVFGEMAFHRRNRSRLSIRPGLVILPTPLHAMLKRLDWLAPDR